MQHVKVDLILTQNQARCLEAADSAPPLTAAAGVAAAAMDVAALRPFFQLGCSPRGASGWRCLRLPQSPPLTLPWLTPGDESNRLEASPACIIDELWV